MRGNRTINVTRIVPLAGKWQTTRNEFQFSAAKDGFGIALSPIKTARGSFEVAATLTDVSQGCAGIVVGYDPSSNTGIFASLGGWNSAYAFGRFNARENYAVSLTTLGDHSILVPKRVYQLKLTVEGVVLSLDVDGATVLQHRLPAPLPVAHVGLYAYGTKGPVKLRRFRAAPAPRKAFVVMPFQKLFDTFFDDVIVDVAKQCGYHAVRVKDVYRPGVIINDVIEGLETSDVVIADVGSLNPDDELRRFNPNVYYEVGYAHRCGTPVILLANQSTLDGRGLPFDIHHFRCIGYTDSLAAKKPLEDALRQHLQSL